MRCKISATKSVTFVNRCIQDVAKCDKLVPSVFCKIAKLHSWVLLNPVMPRPTTTIYNLNWEIPFSHDPPIDLKLMSGTFKDFSDVNTLKDSIQVRKGSTEQAKFLPWIICGSGSGPI